MINAEEYTEVLTELGKCWEHGVFSRYKDIMKWVRWLVK